MVSAGLLRKNCLAGGLVWVPSPKRGGMDTMLLTRLGSRSEELEMDVYYLLIVSGSYF